MRPFGRHRNETALSLIIDLYACFFIPAYTLLYAGDTGWFETNFSVLAATGPGRFAGCLYWGAALGIYFLGMLLLISREVRGSRPVRQLGVQACVCLAAGLSLPYYPERLPQQARLHVLLSCSACVLMMLALLLVLIPFLRTQPKRYRPVLGRWLGIAGVSGCMFRLGGMVTSALEVFFTISAALLVRRLWLLRCADGESKSGNGS